MAEKYWDHLKLKNGDSVKFVPPSPDGERLGGITEEQREKINSAIQEHQDISGKQDVITDLDTIRSGAALGATALQTETDPTVPAWAKAENKPEYTASQVGAIPDTVKNVSYFNNDSGYLTQHQDISNKQDTITDLQAIREGAAAGATALQQVPSTYRTAAEQDVIDATKQETLVSGANIKTLNGQSVLGSGDLEIGGGVEENPNDENGGIVAASTLAEIDKSLKLDNYAADSKTVGDKIDALSNDITSLDGRVTNTENDKYDKTDAAKLQRSVDVLYKLNQGQTYDYETDSAEAYSKAVLSGSVAGTVDSFGGKSVVWNQAVKSYISSQTYKGVTFKNNSDGTIGVSGTAEANLAIMLAFSDATHTVTMGHVYFCPASEIAYSWGYIYVQNNVNASHKHAVFVATTSYTNQNLIAVTINSGETVDQTIDVSTFIDLTQMFSVTTTDAVTDEMKAFCESYAADHPEYNAGEIVSADVTSIVAKNSSAETTATLTIPDAVRALPGYGWSAGSVCNEVDWANRKYVQRVASVDLGTLTWKYAAASGGTFESQSLASIVGDNNCCCAKYTNIETPTSSNVESADDVIAINSIDGAKISGNWALRSVVVKDTDYTDAATFKSTMSGVMLYYELATPIETDISDLLADDNYFETETGGTLTFVQDGTELPVPNTETMSIGGRISALQNDITSLQETKQDTISDIQTIREGANAFECEYGVTTSQDIIDAVDNDKSPWLKYGGLQYRFSTNTNGYLYFHNYQGDTWREIWLAISTDIWNGPVAVQNERVSRKKNAITDSTTDYPTTHAVVEYAEPRKGDWVLKGTISGDADDRGTIDSSVTVDLSGCTEIEIKGDAVVTANATINTNYGFFWYNCFTTSYCRIAGYFADIDGFGYAPIVIRNGNQFKDWGLGYTQGMAYFNVGHTISEITYFKFSNPSVVTSCSIEIYAR